MERALLNRLAEANTAATVNALRLATGMKVNSPSDNPSAFIAISGLQEQLSAVTAVTTNVTAASSLITQTQSALDGIRTQLDAIRTTLLTDVDGGLSASERATAQTAIDTAVEQINTLVGTDIDGRRMLDGSADYNVSGGDPSQVANLRVYSTNGMPVTISGAVAAEATQAELVYTGAGGQTTAAATISVTGERGSAEISVGNSQDLSTVASNINSESYATGVTASVDGDDLTLTSVESGTDVEISVEVSTGTFAVTGGNGDGTANGTDAEVQINGQVVDSGNIDGNRVTVSSNGVHYEIEFAQGFGGGFDTMTVSGDALTFALSTSPYNTTSLSIPSMHAASLGGPSGSLDQIISGGSASGLEGNTAEAIRIVDEALGDLTRVEGSVDGLYNASITSASNLLSDLEDELETAITQTDGYDENEETLLLAKNQALASNAVAGLSVLNYQRSSISLLLLKIAGLT